MRKRIGSTLVFCLLLLVPGVARAQGFCGTWLPVPVPGGGDNGLISVSASSSTDAWAAWKGVYHWNGRAWSPVPAPGLGSPDTVVRSVAAVRVGEAWMVGWTAFLGTPQTLVQRWNGAAWSVVPSPVVQGGSEFDAVAALGSNDAWAVGSRAGGHPEFNATRVTLTAHWDGSRWTMVPSPNVSDRSHELLDIAALAANDVWAVGSSRNIGEDFRTLILHWNGSSWSITPSPNLPGENILYGVSARAANDVWAVGDSWDGITGRQIFLHWDGQSWRQVNGVGGPTACAGCVGDVLAMGVNDVWAVGSEIGHWDGTQWTLVPEPSVPGGIGTTLRSLAKIGPCDAWAVGGSFDPEFVEFALSVRLTPTGAGSGTLSVGPNAPRGLALRVAPSPTRGDCVVRLTLPVTHAVRVTIHDAAGRQVRELHTGVLAAGEHVFPWDGLDAGGRAVGAGVYFVAARAGEQRVTATVSRTR
jgi:hypothetical protein